MIDGDQILDGGRRDRWVDGWMTRQPGEGLPLSGPSARPPKQPRRKNHWMHSLVFVQVPCVPQDSSFTHTHPQLTDSRSWKSTALPALRTMGSVLARGVLCYTGPVTVWAVGSTQVLGFRFILNHPGWCWNAVSSAGLRPRPFSGPAP